MPYSNSPHFGSRERREAYSYYVSSDKIKGGYAADDFAALHFVNGKLERCVSSRSYAKCYKLGKDTEGKLFLKRLKTYFLGEKQHQEDFIWNAPCFEYLREVEEEAQQEEVKPEEPKADTQTELLQPQQSEPLPQLPESTESTNNATDSDTQLQR